MKIKNIKTKTSLILLIVSLIGITTMGLSSCSKSEATQTVSSTSTNISQSNIPVSLKDHINAPKGWKVKSYNHQSHLVSVDGKLISEVSPVYIVPDKK